MASLRPSSPSRTISAKRHAPQKVSVILAATSMILALIVLAQMVTSSTVEKGKKREGIARRFCFQFRRAGSGPHPPGAGGRRGVGSVPSLSPPQNGTYFRNAPIYL
jgi:hypothetical protein